MQSRSASQLPSGPVGLAARGASDDQPSFAGTISSACDAGIGIDNFIAMVRLARGSEPSAARFLDAWDAASGEPSGRSADAICEQVGIVPLDLLKAAASATIRFSTYTAQILAAAALPSVVEQSIAVALTPKGTADRKMQLQHSGFLPVPAGTNIAIQANVAAQPVVVVAPRPEETIRRLTQRFNAERAKTVGGGHGDSDEQDDDT